MTDKLRAHVELMQSKMRDYFTPAPYSDIYGNEYPNNSAGEKNAFIADMVYLLDGPEQREAMAEESVLDRAYAGVAEMVHAAAPIALSVRRYVTNTDNTVTMHFATQEEVFAAMKALAILAPADTKTGVKRGRAVGMPRELGMGYEPITPAIVYDDAATTMRTSTGVGPGAPRK